MSATGGMEVWEESSPRLREEQGEETTRREGRGARAPIEERESAKRREMCEERRRNERVERASLWDEISVQSRGNRREHERLRGAKVKKGRESSR